MLASRRVKQRPYEIEYSPETEDHLALLTRRQQGTILDTVVRKLSRQPTVATRNRKLLRANDFAPWELRIDAFSVYYEVKEAERVVVVKAIGVKQLDRVLVGGEEIEL